MVDASRETYKGNDVKTTVDRKGILLLTKSHIENGLDHKNLQMTTEKYL